MVEAFARIGLALAVAAAAFVGKHPGFDLAARVLPVWAALGLLVALLERRSLRSMGVSLLLAACDIAIFSSVLAAHPQGSAFAYLVFVPALWSITRHQIHPALVAGLVVGLLGAAPLVVPGASAMTAAWIAQTVGLGPVVLLMRRGRTWIENEPSHAAEPTHPAANAQPQIVQDETLLSSYLSLRERFRSLRDHFQALERRSKRDRATVQLIESVRSAGPDGFQNQITQTVRELCGVKGASLYCAAEYGEAMVVRSSSGDLPPAMATVSLPLSVNWTERSLRANFDQWLRALRVEDQGQHARSVVLRHAGRVVGMLCLTDSDAERLHRAASAAEDWAAVIAAMVTEHDTAQRMRRRLRESEMLYAICSVSVGSTTAATLAARVVRELWGVLQADHVGIYVLDGDTATPLATQGAQIGLANSLEFGVYGQGILGWISSHCPETAIFDTTSDERISRREALRRRVGSFLMVPIRGDGETIGFLCAASHRVGGLDIAELETLRIVGAELSQALARLDARQAKAGMATPQELQNAIATGRDGALVVLEPLRLDAMTTEFGQPAMEHALQSFTRRIRASLPPGGLLCRRAEGDYVAYLPQRDEDQARSWANEAAALASMTGVTTPDGTHRIPLAFRAKVSRLRAPEPAAEPKVVKAVFPRVERSEVA